MDRVTLNSYIAQTYATVAEYPWMKYPRYAVYRHQSNQKWFAVVMELPRAKLGVPNDGTIDVLNIKCDHQLVGSLLGQSGFFPAYHMSKTNWITVALDGTVEADTIKWLLDISFMLTDKKSKTNKR